MAGKKRDASERAIVETLRAVGATVEYLSGPNVPDLLVGHCGGNWLMEVKMPKGKVSEGQALWQRNWMGTVNVVRTPEEALRVIGVRLGRTG